MRAGHPIWAQDLDAGVRSVPLPQGPLDLAVVGGGFAGLSTAYHALERFPGLRVAVLEAGRIGDGASGRNTGMVGPGVGQSLPSLVQRVGLETARTLYLATLEAVATTLAIIRREGIDCEARESGQILLARSHAARGRLRRQAELLSRLGLPHTALDDAQLSARLRQSHPQGSDRDGPAALLFETAALVHPAKLAAGLAARVRARGGAVCEGWRVRPPGADDPKRALLALGLENRVGARASIAARRVVVATGGYTPSLGLFRGRVVPLHLQALATAPLPPEALEFLGWAGREGVVEASRIFNYYRLTADDRLVFGGGTPRYLWRGREGARSGERALASLERDLHRAFDGVPGAGRIAVTHAWTGVIDFVVDGLPSIGARRGDPRLLHLLGWCGHGLALSLAAGAWVADRLESGLSGEAPAGCSRDAEAVSLDALARPGGSVPWFRDRPPLVPTEPLRWLGCRAAARALRVLDGWDGARSAWTT